jgi:hypothetical protein
VIKIKTTVLFGPVILPKYLFRQYSQPCKVASIHDAYFFRMLKCMHVCMYAQSPAGCIHASMLRARGHAVRDAKRDPPLT